MSIGDLMGRQERPAYVQFVREAVEDKNASREAGHFVARDVDYVLITPPYSKDQHKAKLPGWFDKIDQDVKNGRLPMEWAARYKEQYRLWQQGQEAPLDGTPIKGWGVISPAQQEMLIRANIRTVEDMAAANDEGLRRVGMGAVDLKNKAQAWLAQIRDKGPLTMEMAALKNENAILKGAVSALEARLKAIEAQSAAPAPVPVEAVAEPGEITAADIIGDEPEPVKRGPGRPRKVAAA